jgi:hypothetical protein
MSTKSRKNDYFETEEGLYVVRELQKMSKNLDYNTGSSFSPDTEHYPDNLIPFIDEHIKYLKAHPNTNPQHYLSNLRLMIRQR